MSVNTALDYVIYNVKHVVLKQHAKIIPKLFSFRF